MANKYWISYRLRDDATEHKEYQRRYKDLIGVIIAVSSREWSKTTSFHLIESDQIISKISSKIKLNITLKEDLVLIRQIDTQSSRYIGQVGDLNGKQYFIPYISAS